MPKIKLRMNSSDGELSIEGDTIDEVKRLLKDVGIEEDRLQRFLDSVGNQTEGGGGRGQRNLQSETRGIPSSLIGKLPAMTSGDLVLLMLLLERPEASKKDLMSRSNELGKPISEEWMQKHFSTKMKGLVTSTVREGQHMYRLSEQGKLAAKARMDELAGTSQK